MISLNNKIVISAILTCAMGTAATATTINSDDSVNPATWGSEIVFDTNDGVGPVDEIISITSVLDLVDPTTTTSTNSWDLSLAITNNSDMNAILTGWGFATNPDVTAFELTGGTNFEFWDTTLGSISGGANNGTTLDAQFCAISDNDSGDQDASNCNGGNPGTGVAAGETKTFDFTLTLAEATTTLDVSDYNIRVQSVSGGIFDDERLTSLKLVGDFLGECDDGSFLGDDCDEPVTPMNPVPLPAGLPLMLSAIGIGAYMRKRSRKTA